MRRKYLFLAPCLWIVILALSSVASESAFGQNPTAIWFGDRDLRLDDLISEARSNNPSLLASRLEAEALAEKRSQVSALPDPMVMFTYQPYPILTARGSQRTQWRVEQMIPFPGKLGLQGDIAELGSEVATFEARTLEEDIILQVKQAYYELYRIQRQDSLLHDFHSRLQNFEEVATTQYEVGIGMQPAVLKAQLEKNMLARSEIDLEEKRRSVAETLAHLINGEISVEDLMHLRVTAPPKVALDEDSLLSIAHRFRPESAALDAALRRSESQIRLARRQYYPDFGINVTYFDIAPGEVPPSANGRDALGIGVSVKIPLQRGRLRAALEEARVRRSQMEARQDALDSSFRTTISDLLNRLRRERDQLTLYRQALIPQAETTLQATLSAYTTGRTDFLNLLDAERVLFMLNSGYEDTFARYLKAAAAFERALGVASLSQLQR